MKQENPKAEVNGGLRMRNEPPRPVKSLNRKNILILLVILSAFLAYVLISGLSQKKVATDKEKPKQMAAQPSQKVSELPDDYVLSELRKIKATPVAKQLHDPEAELIRDAKLKRLKAAQLARESSITFQQVRVDSAKAGFNGFSAGGSEVAGSVTQELPEEDQNKQNSKINFLNKDRLGKEILSNRIREKISDYQLSAGTIIPGVMLTGINSDLPGQILGQVSQNVFDTVNGRHLLIPQGAKIVGEYDSKVVYGQERVLIVWTRILFPDGSSINLEGMAGVDMSGYAGLSDKVNNHYMKLLGGVVFSSLLSASAQMADGRNYNSIDPDFSELATQGAAKNINDVGQQITQKNLNIQPTLEIRPGFRFNVFVNRDMVLRR